MNAYRLREELKNKFRKLARERDFKKIDLDEFQDLGALIALLDILEDMRIDIIHLEGDDVPLEGPMVSYLAWSLGYDFDHLDFRKGDHAETQS